MKKLGFALLGIGGVALAAPAIKTVVEKLQPKKANLEISTKSLVSVLPVQNSGAVKVIAKDLNPFSSSNAVTQAKLKIASLGELLEHNESSKNKISPAQLKSLATEFKAMGHELKLAKKAPALSAKLNTISKSLEEGATDFLFEKINTKFKENFKHGSTLVAPSATLPIDLLDQELINRLSLSSEIAAWLTRRHEEPKCKSINLTNPNPVSSSLTATDLFTERTADVVTLASKFTSAEDAFFYVRDAIQFLPRFGAAQSADQVIHSGSATAADKATLLISLLRQKNIPARYLSGEILVPEAKLKNLYGVDSAIDLAWAQTVLLKNFFLTPQPKRFESHRMVYYRKGKRSWLIPHVWVQAYLNGKWVELDPTYAEHDYVNSNPALSSTSVSEKDLLSQFLFSTDAQGSFIKNGTLVDSLMQHPRTNATSVTRTDLGLSVFNSTKTLPLGNFGGEKPCIEAQSDLIGENLQFKSTVRVNVASDSNPLIQATLPLAAARANALYLVHSAGTLAEGSTGTGTLSLKSGSLTLGSTQIAVGDAIELTHEIAEPKRYGSSAESRTTPGSVAGGVQVIVHNLAPVTQADLELEIKAILALRNAHASKQDQMVRFLRLASMMALVRATENDRDINALRGVARVTESLIVAATVTGQIVDNADHDLGAVPMGTSIDWSIAGPIYSKLGSHTNFSEYTNITYAKGEAVVAGSSIEHEIWEELYGTPAVSTVKVFQSVAQMNHDISPDAPKMELISGETFTIQTEASIFSRMKSGMQTNLEFLKTFENEAPLLYSVTDSVTLAAAGGWTGTAFLIYPTHPLGHAGAFIQTTASGILLGGASEVGCSAGLVPVCTLNSNGLTTTCTQLTYTPNGAVCQRSENCDKAGKNCTNFVKTPLAERNDSAIYCVRIGQNTGACVRCAISNLPAGGSVSFGQPSSCGTPCTYPLPNFAGYFYPLPQFGDPIPSSPLNPSVNVGATSSPACAVPEEQLLPPKVVVAKNSPLGFGTQECCCNEAQASIGLCGAECKNTCMIPLAADTGILANSFKCENQKYLPKYCVYPGPSIFFAGIKPVALTMPQFSCCCHDARNCSPGCQSMCPNVYFQNFFQHETAYTGEQYTYYYNSTEPLGGPPPLTSPNGLIGCCKSGNCGDGYPRCADSPDPAARNCINFGGGGFGASSNCGLGIPGIFIGNYAPYCEPYPTWGYACYYKPTIPTGSTGSSGVAENSEPGNLNSTEPSVFNAADFQFSSTISGTDIALLNGQTMDGAPSNSSSSPTDCKCGQPVNASSGLMWHELTDFKIRGRTAATSIAFTRTYLSQSSTQNTEFGTGGWRHRFETRLYEIPQKNSSSTMGANLVWIDETGGAWTFVRQANKALKNPPGFFGSLTEFNDHYELKKKGGIKLVFARRDQNFKTGFLKSITEPHGEQISFTYDSNSRLKTLSTALAGTVTFSRDGTGRITSITRNRDSLTYTYTYDSSGRLASSSDFDGNITKYEYNAGQAGTKAAGLLSAIEDPLGRRITFTYYDNGRAYEQTEPGNGYRAFVYSAKNAPQKYTRLRDLDGMTTEFRFDSHQRVSELMHPDGAREQTAWNELGERISQVDALGYETTFEYDAHGNLSGIRRPEDTGVTQIAYESNFDKPILMTPLSGSATSIVIDPVKGDVTQIQRADAIGNLSLTFTFDAFGNVLSTNNGRATYANITNADGLVTKLFDARNPATLAYDSRARVTSVTYASGRSITISYDNHDRVLRLDDTANPSIVNTYDVMGRLLTRTITDGTTSQTTSYTWDARDRLIEVSDTLGRKTQFIYDKVAVGCNVVDKPSVMIDPAGRKTLMSYDVRNRLIRSTNANGEVTRFEYNLRGDQTAVTDASGNRTTFEYDGNGRVIKRSRPSVMTLNGKTSEATEVTVYKYDAGGRLTREEKLSASGGATQVTELTYDGLDRVIRKVLKREKNGVVIEVQDDSSYSYQRQLDVTRLASANNSIEQLSFDYEAVAPFKSTAFSVNATDANNPLGLIQDHYTITRDITGEIASLNNAAGNLITSEFDSLGRMKKTVGSFNAQSLQSTIMYDSFGRKRGVVHSTGLVGSYSYDLLNRVTGIYWDGNSTVGGSNEHFIENPQYELTGNIASIQREFGSVALSYDLVDQLTSAVADKTADSSGSALTRYLKYDATGNRIGDSYAGAGTFLANFLLKDDDHSYQSDTDGLGFLTGIQRKSYNTFRGFNYRTDGKMISSSYKDTQKPVVAANYFYDALGRRVAKKVSYYGGSNVYQQSYGYFADTDKILLGKAADGTQTLYVDGQSANEHFGHISSQGVKSYVTDHLGSVLNTEVAGSTKSFGAFGEHLGPGLDLSLTSDPVQYGWQGMQYDSESNLYCTLYRCYDPVTGRWMSIDPIGFAGGDVNMYRFVRNNSIIYIDPLGLDARLVFQLGHIAVSVDNPNAPGGVTIIDLGPASNVSLAQNIIGGVTGQGVTGSISIYNGPAPLGFNIPFTTVTQTAAQDAALIARAHVLQADFTSQSLLYSFPGFNTKGNATNCAGFGWSLLQP